MTIRDHRLKHAAQRWTRGQLQAPPRRRTERATKQIIRRAKRTSTPGPDKPRREEE